MAFRKAFSDYLHDGFDSLTHRVSNYASHKFEDFAFQIERRVISIQDRMIKKFTSSLLFLTSMIFITLGCFYFLREYVNLSNTLSFSTMGIILLMIGLIIKSTERRY